jgi:hypothetical protein
VDREHSITAPEPVTMSPALRRLLLDHQSWCTADCCKERAFRFTEDSIARWLGFERIDRAREIVEEIAKVKADVQRTTGRIFMAARGLESDWVADDFKAFWGRLERAFTLAVESREKANTERGAAADQARCGAARDIIGGLGAPVR